MTKLKLKDINIWRGRPATWDHAQDQQTTRTTLLGTMSWFLVGVTLLFILLSALLIANGSCSEYQGLSARAPVCIGGHLSVQSWLAIVGVEFTILGIIVLPRLQSILISKLLTLRLTHSGMPLAKVLNSQTNAPSWTNIRLGSRVTLFIRTLTFCALICGSILYKFSFVMVGRVDTVVLESAKPAINMGCDNTGSCNGISSNFLNALSTDNSSSSFNITFEPTTSSAPDHYWQVFGPSQNNVANQFSEGDLYLCTPTYYSRNKITPNASDWAPPLLTPYSNLNSLRFTNPADHSIIDVFSSNGTIEVLSGTFGILNQDSKYISKLSASVEVCLGFASWSINNTDTPTSYLQEPIDITCIGEEFNLTSWMQDSSSQFPIGVLQGLGWNTINDIPLQTIAVNIILATLNHTASETALSQTYATMLRQNASIPTPPQCSKANAEPDTAHPWVATGLLPLNGTGMTQLGVVLQALIIVLCVLTLIMLFIPVLPLVTEWPAQWLGLVYGLSPSKIQEVVEGTSAGRNAAKQSNGGQREEGRDGWVWLGSGGGDVVEGCPYLILCPEKGRVRMGRNHV